jgi:hypothetical protein
MNTATQATLFDLGVFGDATKKRGGRLIERIQTSEPDYYTVEIDERQKDFDGLQEVYREMEAALSGEFSHFCIQAHYLLAEGEGEASITLILKDS